MRGFRQIDFVYQSSLGSAIDRADRGQVQNGLPLGAQCSQAKRPFNLTAMFPGWLIGLGQAAETLLVGRRDTGRGRGNSLAGGSV